MTLLFVLEGIFLHIHVEELNINVGLVFYYLTVSLLVVDKQVHRLLNLLSLVVFWFIVMEQILEEGLALQVS